MKRLFGLLFSFMLCCNLNAQILNKIKSRVNQKKEEAENKALDKAEDAATGKKSIDNPDDKTSSNTIDKTSPKTPEENLRAYAKYDFVPGTKVIFEDNLAMETEGEFPSLFNTTSGQAQVGILKGEKVIQSFGCSDLIPRVKAADGGKDYLPDQFTVEFDALFNQWGVGGWWWVNINFSDKSDYMTAVGAPEGDLTIDNSSAKYEAFQTEIPADEQLTGWHHIAIAVNKNLLKVYLNQNRLINTPAFRGNPSAISLTLSPNGCDSKVTPMIKNLRIAEGGIDLYKRATMEGNFIARGINFDYQRATLRPESMGELNRIAKLMTDNPAMKFEIGGHTSKDGTGSAEVNQKLSDDRANSVMKKLVEMGVDGSRLSAKGYGETKPIDSNDTPEGRANNRRVEFVKK